MYLKPFVKAVVVVVNVVVVVYDDNGSLLYVKFVNEL